jgi:hypothetical protein
MNVHKEHISIWQLLVHFCAIIGGVFAVSLLAGKILDRLGM